MLREHYDKKVVPAMMEKFGYKNQMAVPKLRLVSVNVGIVDAAALKTKK